MVTKPFKYIDRLKFQLGDEWSEGAVSPHLVRWVEFDLEMPHYFRLMERNERSGIEMAQFRYVLGEGDFKYILLNSSGQDLERFSTLGALKIHATYLLGFDSLNYQDPISQREITIR